MVSTEHPAVRRLADRAVHGDSDLSDLACAAAARQLAAAADLLPAVAADPTVLVPVAIAEGVADRMFQDDFLAIWRALVAAQGCDRQRLRELLFDHLCDSRCWDFAEANDRMNIGLPRWGVYSTAWLLNAWYPSPPTVRGYARRLVTVVETIDRAADAYRDTRQRLLRIATPGPLRAGVSTAAVTPDSRPPARMKTVPAVPKVRVCA